MTLLAPALLALGAAAVVPLLLHLLQRQQGPRMVFPALRYLRRAERESATRIRLRQLLLLALRVLAVLFLAGAAARPFLRGAGTAHAPTSVVLVLDNSLSTGAVSGERRVLDELREAALASLAGADTGDRFWLIRAGAPWEPAIRGGARAVEEAVRATEPSSAVGDLGGALRRAASILAGEPEGRPVEIHLLSDLQASGLDGDRATRVSVPLRIYQPDLRLGANRSVAAVEVGGGIPPAAGQRSTVTAELEGWRIGGQGEGVDVGTDSVTARLVLDGAVRGVATAPTGATALLPLPALPVGTTTGHVELDADGLRADDRRYFVVEIAPPRSVRLAADAPFLAEAVEALEDAGRVRRDPGGSPEVVIAPGAIGVDAIRSGAGVVLLPPAAEIELGAVNQRLAAAGIPWRYGAPVRGGARLDTAGAGLPVLEAVRLFLTYPLVPADGEAGVRLRLRTGEPWAVSGALPEGGRYVLIGSPLTAGAGTVPTSAAMVPLLDRIVSGWLAPTPEPVEHAPGDLVTVEGDTVLSPDGAFAVEPGSSFRLRVPGIHHVRSEGATVAVWAVNPPRSESLPGRLDAERLASRLGGPDARWANGDAWPGILYHDRLGREITRPLVAAALLLLLIETLVAAIGRGGLRERRPSTPPQPRPVPGGAAARSGREAG